MNKRNQCVNVTTALRIKHWKMNIESIHIYWKALDGVGIKTAWWAKGKFKYWGLMGGCIEMKCVNDQWGER